MCYDVIGRWGRVSTVAGLLASVVGIASYIPYVRSIIRPSQGKPVTRPDRAAWIIWTAEYGLLFAAQLAKKAGSADWLVGTQFACVLTICLLTSRYGVGAIGRWQLTLFGFVTFSLVLWWLTNNPTLAIVLALVVEWSGAILVLRKEYLLPGTESRLSWGLASIAGFIDLWAAGSGILFAYPASLIVMGASIVGASLLGQHTERASSWTSR
ncbi:MAG TPA: hypothetical protein VH637_16860 [Streptosporangiaceae bacterium]|jgi:hypothetical protein